MNNQVAPHVCLPSKNDLMVRLRADGYKFGSVLDVGVMTCTHELLVHFGDTPQLLCEPVEEFHDQIRAYYSGSNVDYILEPRAVSSETGTSELEIISAPGGEGITHSTLVGNAPMSDVTREIKTVTLDDSVAEHQMKAPFLLKVDVDGFEMAVLSGATETLKQTAVLVIEAVFMRVSEIDAFMTPLGFEIYDIIDLCYSDGKFWQCDLVYYNPDLAREMGVVRKDYVEDLSQYQNYVPEDHIKAAPSPVEVITPVRNEMDERDRIELENFRLLSSAAVRELATSGPLDTADWQEVLKARPTNARNWYALKRAARRLSRRG